MFENEITIYRFMHGILKMQTEDITEEEMDAQPFSGANSPRWILAHLAISTDYAAKALGDSRHCPKEWHAAYGPGSTPGAADCPKPTKEELLQAIKLGHMRVSELAAKADPEAMAKPHGIAFLDASPVDTVGQLVTHLMTSHESGHVGQLSYWRRAMGRAPLF